MSVLDSAWPVQAWRPSPATRPPAGEHPGHGRWWFTVCTLTLIVASDYKLRARDPQAALTGGIDLMIVLELACYALVGAYLVLVHARRPPRARRVAPSLYLACFFVGLMVLSVFYTAYPTYALIRAGQMCVLLGLVLATASSATRADLHRFAHGYLVLITLSVAYGVAVPSPPVTAVQEDRFTWLAIHPTVSGVFTGLATVVALGYLLWGRRPRPGPSWPPAAYAAVLMVVGGGMLAVQTRGAVLGAAAGCVVLLVTSRGGPAVVDALLGLLVGVIGVALAASDAFVGYFERGQTTEQLASLNSRTDLWETAVDAITLKPMFGYGVTSSRGIFYDQLGLGGGHNAVVNVLVELGLVGLVCWIALVVAVAVGIGRLPVHRLAQLRLDRALLLAVITFLMVDGVFFEGPGSVTNVASTWFYVSVAWLCVTQRSVDLEPRSNP